MRRVRLSLSLLAAAIAALSRPSAAQNANAVRAQLERRYAENAGAFKRWDINGIMALRAPDFHAVGPDGAVSDRKEMELRTQSLLNGIKKWNAIEQVMDSLRVSGDTAFVTMSQHLDRQALRPDNELHHVETWATQRETWMRINGKWYLARVDQVRNQRRLVDGKSGET
jgi:ketosteroid isomerase-like protein